MVLTTTQNKEQSMTANLTTISVSYQKIENQLQKWQHALEFIKKESQFFIEMLELSIQNADNNLLSLTNFQQKMIDFENSDLTSFGQDLQSLMTDLITNNESREINDLETTHNNLQQRWEEIDTIFKGLKLMAFEKIENGISVKIY